MKTTCTKYSETCDWIRPMWHLKYELFLVRFSFQKCLFIPISLYHIHEASIPAAKCSVEFGSTCALSLITTQYNGNMVSTEQITHL